MNPTARDAIANIIGDYAHTIRPITKPKPAFQKPLLSGMDWHLANAQALEPVVLDQTPRARGIRQIRRIANRHSWGPELIHRAMDDAGVQTEEQMTDEAILSLLEEMQRQHDRAHAGCDDDDAPPAR